MFGKRFRPSPASPVETVTIPRFVSSSSRPARRSFCKSVLVYRSLTSLSLFRRTLSMVGPHLRSRSSRRRAPPPDVTPVLCRCPISRSRPTRPAPFACAGAAGCRRPCCARAYGTAGLTSAPHRRGLAPPRGRAPLPASKPAAEAPASGAGAAHHGCHGGHDPLRSKVEDDDNYRIATARLISLV